MDLKELKKRTKGVAVIQTTPFNDDGSLDLEGMRENTRWLAERAAGRDFIFTPAGSTGEFYAMSEEEIKAVIKMVVEETNGRAVVMAGASGAGTEQAIKMVQYAQSVGADGVQTVLPYYVIPEEEGMYLHYKKIAESVDSNFGIMVYNNPDVSGSWIKPHLMKRLSEIPNIIACKENTPFILPYYQEQSLIDPEDMAIFCGLGEQMFQFEALCGCAGTVSVIANFAPELSYSIYEAAAARDFDNLTKLVKTLDDFWSFVGRVSVNHGPPTNVPGFAQFWAGYMGLGVFKAAMDIVGLRGGKVRLPLVDINSKERAELRDILKAMKVI